MADNYQSASREVLLPEHYRCRFRIRITCDLAGEPITTAGRSQEQGLAGIAWLKSEKKAKNKT
jgi:hypothetical protein